jgi:hypothetical protein
MQRTGTGTIAATKFDEVSTVCHQGHNGGPARVDSFLISVFGTK